MAAMDVDVAVAGSYNSTDGTSTGWSDLPPELAGLVLDRLPSNDDRIRFSSVCRYWRHGARQWSSPAPAFPPWINFMDRELTFQSVRTGKLHIPMHGTPGNNRPIWLGSSDNWLLFFTPPAGNCRFPCFLQLLNPLAGEVLALPATYRSVEQSGLGFFGRLSFHSFIVCSSGNNLVVIANVETDNGPAIACYRPGSSSWSARSYNAGGEMTWLYRYVGIALRHGKLYGLNSKGALFVHDLTINDDTIPTAAVSPGRKLIDGIFFQAKLYLVATMTGHGNKLLMVQRSTTQVRAFWLRIFEADLETCRWKKMERLDDDEILFVSDKFSKAVSAAGSNGGGGGYGDLRRNHIYFLDYACCPLRGFEVRCCMYDLSNDTFHVILPSVPTMLDERRAIWFFPRA